MLVEKYPLKGAPNLYIELFLKAAALIFSHPSGQKRMKLLQTADNYVKRRKKKPLLTLKTFSNALGDLLTILNWCFSVPATPTIIKHIGGKRPAC
jgi:hypothetical protein